MKRFLTILCLVFCVSSHSVYAQMTDDQVIAYAKRGVEQGKSQQQLTKELLARGVTAEQAERIKASLSSSESESSTALTNATYQKVTRNAETALNTVAIAAPSNDDSLDEYRESDAIFGRSVFNNRNLSFEPNMNAPTPQNYIIGPGDEIIIEIWGFNETRIAQTISPEGRINISQVGPIQLNGLTIAQASKKIKTALSSKYSGLEGEQSSVTVSLGRIRTIQVNIMGEVGTPGTYRLSSFSTVFHALYNANGITRRGSLRSIKVIREGKQIATVDVYGYILEGKSNTDIALQDGDIIIVPTYSSHIQIKGSVKRPMIYELKEGETLSTLIGYAGGYTSNAFTQNLKINRETELEKEIATVEQSDYSTFALRDGDIVTIGINQDRYSNMAEIRGFVFRPDMYEIGGDIKTIKDLVAISGGPKEDAFLDRVVLLREKEDLSVETISLNLSAILNGSSADITLHKNDLLVISGKYELNDRGTLSINGLVRNPNTFPFTDNTSVEDLIIRAGGLLEGASMVNVEVARRVYDPNSLEVMDTLSIVHRVEIKEGFTIDKEDSFILEPYDIVSVRRAPGFDAARYVTITGAVNFPGSYPILYQGETLTEIISRAGGLTKQANIDGVRLRRTGNNNNNIINQVSEVLRKNSKRDTTDATLLQSLERAYLVAVDLGEALKAPKSYADVILEENDEIIIPELDNTIKVMGEVMFPVAINYADGKPLRYYIDAAGGFTENAKRAKVYVIYPNASAAKSVWGNAKLKPGSIVIVPTKPEPKPMQLGEISAITSASTSLVSLAALLTNLFRK